MTLEQMLKRAQERLTSLIATRKTHTDKLTAMRAAVEAGDSTVTIESIDAAIEARAAIDSDVDKARTEIASLEAEIAREAEIAELAKRSTPAAPAPAPRSAPAGELGSPGLSWPRCVHPLPPAAGTRRACDWLHCPD